jgi:hypothetical protein
METYNFPLWKVIAKLLPELNTDTEIKIHD